MKFNKFTKWFLNAVLASSLLITQPCFAQQTTLKTKNKSLEQTLITGGEIKDSILQQKKADVKFKFQYDKENKELSIGIYTEGWDKEIQLQAGKIHALDNDEKIKKEYINIRYDSEVYLILRKSFNITDIIEKGYIIQDKEGKSKGEWERLIPAGDNPDLKLKSFISKKTFSEVLDFFNRSDTKSTINAIFDYASAKREQKIDDIAEQMGEEYEVYKIELYTPKGLETKVNAAAEMKLKFENNPEEDRNTLFVYNLNFGPANSPIGVLHSKGAVAFDIQGLKQSSYRYPDQSNPKNAYITYELAYLNDDYPVLKKVMSERVVNQIIEDHEEFSIEHGGAEETDIIKEYVCQIDPNYKTNTGEMNKQLEKKYQKCLEEGVEAFPIINDDYAIISDGFNSNCLLIKENNLWKYEQLDELLEKDLGFKEDYTNYWLNTIAEAVENYYSVHGRYPIYIPSSAKYYFSNSLSQEKADGFKTILEKGINDPYYKKELNQEIIPYKIDNDKYYYSGWGGNKFEIYSVGPNGKDDNGKGDDIIISKEK